MKPGDWEKAIRGAWPEGCLCLVLDDLFRLVHPDTDVIDKGGSAWGSFRQALLFAGFVVDDCHYGYHYFTHATYAREYSRANWGAALPMNEILAEYRRDPADFSARAPTWLLEKVEKLVERQKLAAIRLTKDERLKRKADTEDRMREMAEERAPQSGRGAGNRTTTNFDGRHRVHRDGEVATGGQYRGG